MPKLTDAELAMRTKGMGSTCIVEANGLAPWKGAGPMRLWCEKTGIVVPDDEEYEPEDREHLEWGHTLEPVIADWYERTYSVQLQLGGPRFSTVRPTWWATLDRLVIGQNKLLEIKNVGAPAFFSHWHAGSPDGIPDYVRAQVTIALDYTGARECDVAASIGGRPPVVWTVFPNPELAALLLEGADRFWRCVESREPPPLDHTQATREYLRHTYPDNIAPNLLEIEDVDQIMRARARAEAADMRKAADQTVKRLDAEMMRLVGDADGITGSWGKFTWKKSKDGKRPSRFTARNGGSDE